MDGYEKRINMINDYDRRWWYMDMIDDNDIKIWKTNMNMIDRCDIWIW